jgi:predicted ATP-grasp superfamily ATP-dependent carboligase
MAIFPSGAMNGFKGTLMRDIAKTGISALCKELVTAAQQALRKI